MSTIVRAALIITLVAGSARAGSVRPDVYLNLQLGSEFSSYGEAIYLDVLQDIDYSVQLNGEHRVEQSDGTH